MDRSRVAVIGGGASGIAAAIAAAKAGAEVTVFEQNDRVGKKILATGNGKCNFSNKNMGKSYYNSGDMEKVDMVLHTFGAEDAIAFFQNMGMLVKDKNGYLYPFSEQASTVLDILRSELVKQKVTVVTGTRVCDIKTAASGSFIIMTDGQQGEFDRIIIACGGKASPQTGSDGNGYHLAQKLGHTLVPVVPALVQLKCSEKYMKTVSGVRTEAEVVLQCGGKTIAAETGELQLTEYGISGIVVFQVSREAAYALYHKRTVKAYINCLPAMKQASYAELIRLRKQNKTNKTVEEFFTGMLNKKLMSLFIKTAGLRLDMPVSEAEDIRIDKVFSRCRCWELTVCGTNSFEQAQVCAGGVDMKEVTGELESRKQPGVYFAGEILDVDGKCGGYNLQWAWASGYLAGTAAGKVRKQYD